MKSLTKKIAVAGLLLSSSSIAFAGASGNVALSSDYLWRGLTQTGHGAAVSGGLDYEHSTGLYVGTWASNVALDTEIDFYGGFSKEFGAFGIDIGGIYYAYPQPGAAWSENFYEGYLGLSYSIVAITGYYNPTGPYKGMYGSAEIEYELSKTLKLGASGGYAMPDGGGEYAHYGVSLTKTVNNGDFVVSVSDTDNDTGMDSAPLMTVSYSMEFDL